MNKKTTIPKHPFKTPENYFSSLEDSIQKSVQGEFVGETLKSISKENVFQTPDDYFHDLPSIIQSRIHREKTNSWLPQSKWHQALSLSSIAAVFVIGLFLLFKPSQEVNSTELLSEVSTEDLLAYIDTEDNYEDVLSDLIIEVEIEAEYLNNIEVDDKLLDELDFTEEELLDDYFSKENNLENIEPEDLI